MPFALILFGTALLGALYGGLRDGLLWLTCPEYFTTPAGEAVGADLAVAFGAATFGTFGLMLGLGLACAARLGRRPKRGLRDLLRPILFLLAVVAGFSLLAGIVGAVLTHFGVVVIPPEMRERFPMGQWGGLQFCWFTHVMGNYVGFPAGGVQVVWVWASRARLKTRP